MPVSRALRRLLHVRAMEEEQYRQTLDSALGELRALQHALNAAHARKRTGRNLLAASLQGEIADRTAAQVEMQTAIRCADLLVPRIASAESVVFRARQEYLDKRLERRQAQTLIEEGEAQDATESGRRAQQSLDETFGTLHHRQEHGIAAHSRSHSADLEQEWSSMSSPLPESGTNSKV